LNVTLSDLASHSAKNLEILLLWREVLSQENTDVICPLFV